MRFFYLLAIFFLGVIVSDLITKPKEKEVEVKEKVVVQTKRSVEFNDRSFIEYVPIVIDEDLSVVSQRSEWIDPNTIPHTKRWYIYTGETTHQHLVNNQHEHKIKPEQIKGWTEDQLKNLHNYLHNGGDRFWEP